MTELDDQTAGAETATAEQSGAASNDTADNKQQSEQDAEQKPEEKVPYQLSAITDLPGSRKRVNFTVAWDDYHRQADVFYQDLRENANIEGFRKGRAPFALVRARYGRDVKKQASTFIIENCTQQIVDEQQLQVYRRMDDQLPELRDNQPLEFATTLEVKPVIDPVGYDAFEASVETRPIVEQLIADQLENIRRQNGSLVEKDEGATIAAEDAVTLSTRVFDEHGHAIEHLCWNMRQIHSLRQLPEAVSNALTGRKKGDAVSAVVETRHGDQARQQKWEIDVKEIKRLDLPALDDEFAQDVGNFKNLEELRGRIRKDMEDSREEDERRQALEQIHDQLIARNPFDLPDLLVDLIQYQMITEDVRRLRQLGVTLSDLGQSEADYRGRTRENSEKLTRINLLLDAIGKKEQIETTDVDVDAEINKMAERAGRKPLAIRANLEAENRWESFRDNLRMDKIADFLIARTKLNKVEKPVSSEQ